MDCQTDARPFKGESRERANYLLRSSVRHRVYLNILGESMDFSFMENSKSLFPDICGMRDKIRQRKSSQNIADSNSEQYSLDRKKVKIGMRKSLELQNLIENFAEHHVTHKIKRPVHKKACVKRVLDTSEYNREFEGLFKDDFTANHYNLKSKVDLEKIRLGQDRKMRMRSLHVLASS